jgi:acetyl-CoA carboxylase beta subunit
MGKVVGEKITRAVEKATSERLPIIIFQPQMSKDWQTRCWRV